MSTENNVMNELQTNHPDFWTAVGESLFEPAALPRILNYLSDKLPFAITYINGPRAVVYVFKEVFKAICSFLILWQRLNSTGQPSFEDHPFLLELQNRCEFHTREA